jgi:long-subunit acyl-CoA synthetase (AMP-forming)
VITLISHKKTACRLLFTTLTIGKSDNSVLLSKLSNDPNSTPWLEEVIILNGDCLDFRSYDEAATEGANLPGDELEECEKALGTYELCMLLFTSGSTGNPKAASLTHQ